MPKSIEDDANLPKSDIYSKAAATINPDLNTLVMSLASYVTAEDIGLDRKEFLRLVSGRILDDLGI
jgi:hypothetical protein